MSPEDKVINRESIKITVRLKTLTKTVAKLRKHGWYFCEHKSGEHKSAVWGLRGGYRVEIYFDTGLRALGRISRGYLYPL